MCSLTSLTPVTEYQVYSGTRVMTHLSIMISHWEFQTLKLELKPQAILSMQNIPLKKGDYGL